MAIFDLFSNRQKRATGEPSEVFKYDVLPAPLRAQIVHIWGDALGVPQRRHYGDTLHNPVHWAIYETIIRETGVLSLPHSDSGGALRSLSIYFLEADVAAAIDLIEVSFSYIARCSHESWNDWHYQFYVKTGAADAISELNSRFMAHEIGYEFVLDPAKHTGQLVKKNEQILHGQVVLPALNLLHDGRFAGANAEYLSAHTHYRHGRYKECLADCLKAFESTMKTICKVREWNFDGKDTAHKLIGVCLENELVPSYLQSHFTAFRSMLESGVPTVRNKVGGHGQGAKIIEVPPHLAAFLLHSTAALIVLLVEAERSL